MTLDGAAEHDQEFFASFGAVGAPEAFRRAVNEKIALIEGMTELLLYADGEVDHTVGRAALEAIARNTAGLRLLLSPAGTE